ncbi:bifunctional oligoribonuclease/PAP phosphatase NrnA [Candidatus Microgenomates bacterium]|nr:bifunctional oligoribonuclease/PAP phosphatase NrnA [Candidatus Microgenomates bacterium]
MNYSESQEILEKIKTANKIILNCHYSPDPDSVSSALSMYQVLTTAGKEVKIYSPGEIWKNLEFLPNIGKIEVVDFAKVDYSKFDLFISLDSSTWDQGTGTKDFEQPKNIEYVVIDHHKSNPRYGDINLINGDSVSTCEVLFEVFEDWKIEIDKNLATTLLTGIIADSGAFRYPATSYKTLEISAKLIKLGADREKIIFEMFSRTEVGVMKFWGLALSKLKVEHGFAWTAISHDELKDLKDTTKAKSSFASVFLQSIDATDFGFIAVEEKPKLLDVSLRSRTGVDTSKIAVEFGGGGHIWASGFRIEGLSFEESIEKVLEVARKYAKS